MNPGDGYGWRSTPTALHATTDIWQVGDRCLRGTVHRVHRDGSVSLRLRVGAVKRSGDVECTSPIGISFVLSRRLIDKYRMEEHG